HPVDQVAHGYIAARALGDLYLGSVTHDLDHLVQDVGRVILGDADVQSLQAGTDTGHGTVVVAALYVDGVVVTAFPLGDVVGDVRHEIGVTAVRLAHDAVFIVTRAQFGDTQPRGAFMFIRVAGLNQFLDGLFHSARCVE